MTIESLRGWWRRLTQQDGDVHDVGRLDAEKARIERDQREMAEQLARLRAMRAERDLYQRRVGG